MLTIVSQPVRREGANRVVRNIIEEVVATQGAAACRIMTEVLEVRPSCLLSHLRAGELFKLENIVITRYNAILCV